LCNGFFFNYISGHVVHEMPKRNSLQAQLDAHQKTIDAHQKKIDAHQKKLDAHQKTTDALLYQLFVSRKHARAMAYAQMLNTYLNIIKYVQMAEPKPMRRRSSKQFQNSSHSTSMELFLKVVYPLRSMEPKEIKEYFKKVDALKDQRDRITHPRSVVELSDDAHRYAAMLEDHRASGDVLESKEVTFLEVFSKIDDLRANGVGNLC